MSAFNIDKKKGGSKGYDDEFLTMKASHSSYLARLIKATVQCGIIFIFFKDVYQVFFHLVLKLVFIQYICT